MTTFTPEHRRRLEGLARDECWIEDAAATPPAFAELLIGIAKSARRAESAA